MGFLFISFQRSCPIVSPVYIEEAIALAHLARGSAHKINTSPRGIPQKLHAVLLYGLLHCPDMLSQIRNPVIILYRIGAVSVLDQFILRPQAVFYDKKRLLVTVIQCVQRNAQAERIDLPSPFTDFQIRILRAFKRIPNGFSHALLRCHAAGGIIGQADKVDCVLL